MSQGGSSGRVAAVLLPNEPTISLAAFGGDLETLERDVIVPMVNSVSASIADE